MGWIGFNREQVRRLWGNYNLTALGLIHFRSLVFVGVHVQCLVRSAALHMYAVLNLCGPFARTALPSSYQIIIKLLNCFLSV